jgi:ABC-type iron transport system FetAB permease component
MRLRWIAFTAPVVLLAAFHGALLLRHFADASITRPMVLGRWAFAITLLAAAFIARRLFNSRHAVITFWLLVAVLHLAAPANNHAFDVRENLALLVAVLPALIVISATAAKFQSARWPTSTLLRDASVAFVPLRLDPFQAGRAPPSF